MFTNQNKFSCVLVLMSLACAVEPSVKQTANQRVAFEEDENPHLPTNAKAKESDAKPEVRVKEKSEEKNSQFDSISQEDNISQEQENNVSDDEMSENPNDLANQDKEDVEVPQPSISIQSPDPSNFFLLSENTISVPITMSSGANVDVSFTVKQDPQDMLEDISVIPEVSTLSFISPGTQMLEINFSISSQSSDIGNKSIMLIATPDGGDPVEVPIAFTVEKKINIDVTNISNGPIVAVGDTPAGTTFTSGGVPLGSYTNGSNQYMMNIRKGTVISFNNMSTTQEMRIHMNQGFHQGDASPPVSEGGEISSYVITIPDDQTNNVIAYDHDNQSGDDAFRFVCIDCE